RLPATRPRQVIDSGRWGPIIRCRRKRRRADRRPFRLALLTAAEQNVPARTSQRLCGPEDDRKPGAAPQRRRRTATPPMLLPDSAEAVQEAMTATVVRPPSADLG